MDEQHDILIVEGRATLGHFAPDEDLILGSSTADSAARPRAKAAKHGLRGQGAESAKAEKK